MSNLIGQLPKEFINGLDDDLIEAIQYAFRIKTNQVTGQTIKSVRTSNRLKKKSLTLKGFASGGAKFQIEGKRANTKLPVRKKGKKFVLVKQLAMWAKLMGFRGPDFVLANSIAKKERLPIDIATPALKKFNELSLDKLSAKLTEIKGKNIIKTINL